MSVYSVHFIMIFSYICLAIIILVQFSYAVFSKDDITIQYISGYRQVIMNFVQHLKAFCLLLVYYYVEINSQRKTSKKSKKNDDGYISNNVSESEEGKENQMSLGDED